MKKIAIYLLLLLPPSLLVHAQTAGMQARLFYATSGGSVNAMTLTQAGAVLSAGQIVIFTPNLANTTTTPTLNLNSLGAKTITRNGNAALAANDLITSAVAYCVYDGTQWELLNPQTLYVPSNGTNPGSLSLPGNTTAPTLPTSTFSIIGPNVASFTAYGWQVPSTANTGGQIPLLGTPSGGITPITYASTWHLVGSIVNLTAQGANIGATTIITTTAAGFYRMCATASVTRVATTSMTLPVIQGLFTGGNDSVTFRSLQLTPSSITSNSTQVTGTGCSGVFYAAATSNVQYNVVGYASNPATGTGAMQFDMQVALEAAQ